MKFASPLKVLFLVSVMSLFLTESAQAGFIDFCKKLLSRDNQTAQHPNLQKLPQRYRKFIDGKAKELPPVATYSSSTSIADLLLSFSYWWFPGNIWHSLMFPNYQKLAEEVTQAHERAQIELPSLESLPRVEALRGETQQSAADPASGSSFGHQNLSPESPDGGWSGESRPDAGDGGASDMSGGTYSGDSGSTDSGGSSDSGSSSDSSSSSD